MKHFFPDHHCHHLCKQHPYSEPALPAPPSASTSASATHAMPAFHTTSPPPPPPRLNHVFDIHIELAPPAAGSATPVGGPVNFFQITSGRISSALGSPHPPLSLAILPGGGDYTTLHPAAGVVTLDINMVAQEGSSGALFRFQNSGFIHMSEKVGKVLAGEASVEGTEFGAEAVFETIRASTGSEEHAWVNWATMVAQGRLVVEAGGLKGIEFRAYELLRE